MRLLAIETAFGPASVFAGTAGDATSGPDGVELTVEGGAAEGLVATIQSALSDAGLAFGALDRVAVTLGPGTFTGLRSGLACVRALRLALDVPVVATTSLAVMAFGARQSLSAQTIGIAVDARRGALFVGRFEGADDVPLEPLALMSPEEAAVAVTGRCDVCVGSGAALVAAAAERQGRSLTVALPDLAPTARWLAALAPGLVPTTHLEPLYLRAPDARPQADMPRARGAPPGSTHP